MRINNNIGNFWSLLLTFKCIVTVNLVTQKLLDISSLFELNFDLSVKQERNIGF